jgi:hypothetical protein
MRVVPPLREASRGRGIVALARDACDAVRRSACLVDAPLPADTRRDLDKEGTIERTSYYVGSTAAPCVSPVSLAAVAAILPWNVTYLSLHNDSA